MKNQGKDDHVFDTEENGQEAMERDDRKWNDRTAAFLKDNKIEIPYIGRPRGKGVRMDFYAPGQLPDIALEIKEATGRRFKNTNDIHRAAHYLGMYLMKSMEVSSKASGWLAKMLAENEPLHIEAHVKAAIKHEFQLHFEQYALGSIGDEVLEKIKKRMLKAIPCPNIKQWAEDEFEDMMTNPGGEFKKLYNKITVQRHRDKKKQLGLRVVGAESD